VLNLGLNDAIVESMLAAAPGDEVVARWVFDNYRRLIQMYADVVRGVDLALFEAELSRVKEAAGASTDVELSPSNLRDVISAYKRVFEREAGEPFPQDPWKQLYEAVAAVFASWNNSRAVRYRQINEITGLLGEPDAPPRARRWARHVAQQPPAPLARPCPRPPCAGTAVNVMAMVYGNRDDESGTGVLFTRNPSTGEDELFGEYLFNAQGEDVVSGSRSPRPIAELEERSPRLYAELLGTVKRLERHFLDVQDCEFTIESGVLYMLQTRNGKRTGPAAVRIATDMVAEGLVTKEDAVARLVTPKHLDQALHARLRDPDAADADLIAKGTAASPGAAAGRVAFTAGEAEEMAGRGLDVLLVREETSPEDIGGMHAAKGVLTARGGMTSHAAVVARSWGKPCVAGAGSLRVDVSAGTAVVHGTSTVVRRGDWITIDGSSGKVYLGSLPMADPDAGSGELGAFLEWVHAIRRMKVKANADTPEDAARAVQFGAQGVGLVRTEHMFFQPERITAMRRMILASEHDEQVAALAELEPLQASDFEGIFRAVGAAGPVTIRLLDPPLHEFLPQTKEQQSSLARHMGIRTEEVRAAVEAMREANPMTGHRGCRVGITRPAVTRMQARAIFTAAKRVAADGVPVQAEVMVPLVGVPAELKHQAALIDQVAMEVFSGGAAAAATTHDGAVAAALASGVVYRVGTMIEVPRACLAAGALAETAEFFSVGSNDLTQLTFGYSRDDAGPFVSEYLARGILPADPFVHVDEEGVAALIAMAAERGRAARPGIPVGVCGEHGGDPQSVHVFDRMGLDYVSCSPFRVPVAALSAAQATLLARKYRLYRGCGPIFFAPFK